MPAVTDMPGEYVSRGESPRVRRWIRGARAGVPASSGPEFDEPGQEIQPRLTGKRSGRSAMSHTRPEQVLRKASKSPANYP